MTTTVHCSMPYRCCCWPPPALPNGPGVCVLVSVLAAVAFFIGHAVHRPCVMCGQASCESPAHDAIHSDALRALISAQCNDYHRRNCSDSDRATITMIDMQVTITTMRSGDDCKRVTNQRVNNQHERSAKPPRGDNCVRTSLET